MKRKGYVLLLSILLLFLVLCFSSCKNDGEDIETDAPIYTVSFDTQGGTVVAPQRVTSGDCVAEPAIPSREGYVFDHWKNKETKTVWNFVSGIVKGDMTLEAVWIDAGYIFTVEPIGDSGFGVLTGIKEKEKKAYQIPTVVGGFTVSRIGAGALANLNHEYVEKIILPETVTEIEDGALENCRDIQITVLGELSLVGEQAFKNCNLLSEITLGEGLTALGAEAFWGCTSLREVRLPTSLRAIGENAFQDCSSLAAVLMHDGVEEITNGAFHGCESLQVLYLSGNEERLLTLLDEAATMNEPFVTCERQYLYSENEPTDTTEFDGFWYLDANDAFRLWKTE